MPTVGVILSGCGVMDGSEIHEAVLTLLALDRAHVRILCMAPDVEQREVINHLTNQPLNQKRNVLVESARIARGDIRDIKKVSVKEIDALILPGGWGAAKNLCSFAYDGTDCSVHPEVERLINETIEARKPIGVICIAPALLARVIKGKPKAKLTIGSDSGAAKKIELLGAEHVNCTVERVIVDEKNKIVSTPAYMLAKGIAEAEKGISELVKNVLALREQPIPAR